MTISKIYFLAFLIIAVLSLIVKCVHSPTSDTTFRVKYEVYNNQYPNVYTRSQSLYP